MKATEHKIMTGVRLTPRQVAFVRTEAKRIGISEADAHRRLLDEAIEARQAARSSQPPGPLSERLYARA